MIWDTVDDWDQLVERAWARMAEQQKPRLLAQPQLRHTKGLAVQGNILIMTAWVAYVLQYDSSFLR